MKFKTKLITLVVAFLAAISFALPSQVNAAKGDIGVDWAVYQGANGKYGTNNKFAIIQAGGTQGGTLYDQWTYASQVKAAQANGLKTHTYLWYGVGGSADIGRQALDYFLPKILTPKGSIVALDYEDGASSSMAANTDAILYGMRRIAQAGYTPMYYSYKPYTLAHVDYQRILAEFPNSLWIAAYPDYQIRALPDYGVFPSMPGIALYQFTSMHAAGGLDGNVDLTGITDSGYNGSTTTDSGKTYVKPSTNTPATNAGQQANNTTLSQIKVGDSVKVNFGTTRWANGVAMPSWVQGKTYTVQQVSGSNVLLGGIMSWINRSNVELLTTTSVPSVSSGSTYTVQSGDSWWSIAYKYGMSMYTLAANNGKTISSVIYPGDVLRVSGASYSSHTYYTARSGDSFWSIANKYGISMYTLAANNGKSIYSLIYPGEDLYIR
ncbi:LysM peptidoglycan-binding domain-containing protein [Lacticaseibacillus mingshuiensis]|uniref:LysM peptidoglycan-binding domain-containing protein n=1 Tax=Lacticaseibacillus mingshuiensis TaxID=2799574 RepID=A0ABW4CJG9_9LACO|nr:LysM peptidoglycan-binding domain-containing protein [Lacticaseibacillus mingshuiensis]